MSHRHNHPNRTMIRTAAASALRTVTKNTRQMSSVAATPMPRERMIALRAMLDDASFDRPVRVLETHNGLTGLIAEQASVEVDGKKVDFDDFRLVHQTGGVLSNAEAV